MKLTTFILASFLFSSLSFAQEIPYSSRKIIFEVISDMVAFEDEGYYRLPQKIEDFEYTLVDESMIQVQGDSYSEWDDKNIHYNCFVKVLTRGMIQSAQDVAIECEITGENWPYY